eukprot:2235831-Alexandrium_andersonii.AAC.1
MLHPSARGRASPSIPLILQLGHSRPKLFGLPRVCPLARLPRTLTSTIAPSFRQPFSPQARCHGAQQ